MKVLIVSDNDAAAQSYSSFFTSKGWSVIRYRWPIKAMDNIEEIDPQLILVNAVDFPRHWKPLVQYVYADKTNKKIAIFLLVEKDFEQDEARKANFLKVVQTDTTIDSPEQIAAFNQLLYDAGLVQETENDFTVTTFSGDPFASFSSFSEDAKDEDDEEPQSVAQMTPQLNIIEQVEIPPVEDISAEDISAEDISAFVKCLIINPTNSKLLTGKVLDYKEDALIFEPDYIQDAQSINKKIANSVVIKKDENLWTVRAAVTVAENRLHLIVLA